MLRAKIVLSQAEDRDSDNFKSRFREHPVPKVRDVYPKIGPAQHKRDKQPLVRVGRAGEHLGQRAGHAGS